VAGDVERDGKWKWSQDIYARERLLFVTKMPFNKVGVIGKFWGDGLVSKGELWAKVKEVEHMIAEGLKQDGVSELCDWLYAHYFGKKEPLVDIQRSIGLHAHDDYVQDWIVKIRNHKARAY
jgi:hypothetical protein